MLYLLNCVCFIHVLCLFLSRSPLSDFDSLNEADGAKNNQLAFEVAERAFGIQPLITGKEMVAEPEPDKLVMVLYLSKFYEMFRNSSLPAPGILVLHFTTTTALLSESFFSHWSVRGELFEGVSTSQ